jgi:hypothetical protein
MRTINGKLINQGKQNLEKLQHQTANMMQNHQDLQAQITAQETKHANEINTIKSHFSTLDKRCILLEESISRQFTQFLIINICGIIGLIFLYHWFDDSSKSHPQPNNRINQSIERKIPKQK